MTDTWFIGDLHLGHKNIITFDDNNGKKIRPFKTLEEHDETLIDNINKLVNPKDRLYMLGDVVINRKALPMLSRINGRKKLIKGNHDIFKLKDYTPYFEDISAYRIYKDAGIICSHIPVHTSQLEFRFKLNVHGHTHSNNVQKTVTAYSGIGECDDEVDDTRYLNICPEHTDFKPVNFDWLVKTLKERQI